MMTMGSLMSVAVAVAVVYDTTGGTDSLVFIQRSLRSLVKLRPLDAFGLICAMGADPCPSKSCNGCRTRVVS